MNLEETCVKWTSPVYEAATVEITLKKKPPSPSVRGCYNKDNNKKKNEVAPVYEAVTVEITIKRKMN